MISIPHDLSFIYYLNVILDASYTAINFSGSPKTNDRVKIVTIAIFEAIKRRQHNISVQLLFSFGPLDIKLGLS